MLSQTRTDRGFKDAHKLLSLLNIQADAPRGKANNASQQSTSEANESRLVTKLRWVVESVNSRLKRWKFFKGTISAKNLHKIRPYLRIICAILNAFRGPLTTDHPTDASMVEQMVYASKQQNSFADKCLTVYVATEASKWIRLGPTDLPDFPKLTIAELQQLSFGVYQLCQAKSYIEFHKRNHNGIFHIEYHKFQNNILLLRGLTSRHKSRKSYHVWLQYASATTTTPASGCNKSNEYGRCRLPFLQWYCKCIPGKRLVGFCAHVAAFLYFMCHLRHEPEVDPISPKKRKAEEFDDAQDSPTHKVKVTKVTSANQVSLNSESRTLPSKKRSSMSEMWARGDRNKLKICDQCMQVRRASTMTCTNKGCTTRKEKVKK